jgi:hypothetical protein
VAGDMGRLDLLAGVRAGFASEILDPAFGGDDTVEVGTGDTWIILGEGNDRATNQGGLNIVIGDAGYVRGDANGVYLRAESTQPTIGGNDTIIGGTGRDVQIGGAGRDYLDGRSGDDLMSGDGALIHRDPAVGNGQITFESRDIRAGGADTLIGGDGNGYDILYGGIGNDLFDLDIGYDIAVGEFARVRLQPRPSGPDLVTSFLTPAMRDLDLLAQITLGVNLASSKTTVEEVPGTTIIDLGDLSGIRFYVVYDEGSFGLWALAGAGDAGRFGDIRMPGLIGFNALSADSLLMEQPIAEEGEAEQQPSTDGRVPDGADGEGSEVEAGALSDQPQVAASGKGGWKMTGWRLFTPVA